MPSALSCLVLSTTTGHQHNNRAYNKLRHLIVIGYTQQVWYGSNWVAWDNCAYMNMKSEARQPQEALKRPATAADA
jgi:hypothetical protein